MAEVASAYVSLLPSFKGGAAAISKEMGGPLDKAGQDGGQRFGGGMRAGIAGLATKIFAPLAAAASGVAIVGFFKGAITEASGLTESVNALNVSYGDASEGVQSLGKAAATNLGLSNLEFNNLAVRFSAFSKTIAGDGGDVTATLDDLTTRASDFASVMNLDVSEAAQLFQSGLAGETEPLRKFGIDLSAAAVEAFGLANGMAANGKTLTEAEKVQARYGLLMQQTAATQGDFANTSGELANQQRILGARFDDVKAQVGTAFLPIMQRVVGFLADNVQPTFDTLKGGVTALAAAFKAGGDDVTSSGFAGGMERIGLFARKVYDVFNDSVLPVLKSVGGYITGTLVPSLVTFGGWVVKNKDWLLAIGVAVATVVAGIKAYNIVMGIWRAGTVAATAIQAAYNAVLAANPIGIIILAIAALVAGLVYFFTQTETGRKVWADFTAFLSAAWETIQSAFQTGYETVRRWLSQAWEFIKTVWSYSPLGLIVTNWDKITGFFGSIPGKIRAFVDQAWEFIKTAFSYTPLGIIVTNFDAIVQFFKDIPGNIMTALGNLGNLLADAGRQIIEGLLSGITNKFEDVKDFVSGIGDWIADHKGPKAYDLKLLVPAGGWLMDGLRSGIEAELPALEATLNRVTRTVSVGGDLGSVTAGYRSTGGTGGGVTQNIYPAQGLSEAQIGNVAARRLEDAFMGESL